MRPPVPSPSRLPLLAAVAALAALAIPSLVVAATAAPSAPPASDGWPRVMKTATATYSVYAPQIDSWDGRRIELDSPTLTDKLARVVELEDLRVVKATFPAIPDREKELQAAFQGMAPARKPVIALDRIEAQLAILGAEKKGQAQPVRNVPPRIVFAETAA